uniref:Peptidase S1 domain-containing protein n=1 Tax=Panagrellus redivivus TaxID=6233 RepID=A0A7E4ZQM2_PANRE
MQISLLILFLCGTTVAALGYQCGQTPILPEDNRIVGGAAAVPHSWPWQVLLQITTRYNKTHDNVQTCGGTIISNYWILTAAHCFDKTSDPDDIEVYSGNHYVDAPAVLHRVENVIIHPKYDSIINNRDIALIELAAPIKYNRHTRPICLPSWDKNIELTTKTAWATGWGDIEQGASTNELLQVEVPFVDMPTCRSTLRKAYPLYPFDKRIHLCAGKESRDACQGDSGGPLVFQTDNEAWFQVGITSWGVGCGETPGVYTRVSAYCGWIYSTTNGDVDCQRN